MKAVFELFLSASFFGSVMILLVVAARFVLRKAPRGIFCLLWVLVGLRLLIPFRIESNLSLQPSFVTTTMSSIRTPNFPGRYTPGSIVTTMPVRREKLLLGLREGAS